ncbi:MAG: MBL fold metallo-hydrolase [Oscillospiraceae bacterium]|nr:MBL fold metallo-hydrolase [Oscillospiraceae bacterium]
MARIYPLFSSSKGNCTYIGTKEQGILIDDGVSYSRLCKALELNGLSTSCIKAVFVTHEHSDHIKGLSVLTKKHPITVYAQAYTLDILEDRGCINGKCEELKESADIIGMNVRCFPTDHDTGESCGYRITFGDGKSCAVCTDLGHITDIVEENLLGADAVLLEANYDVEMLRNGPYEYYLKTRIFSNNGHLSNDDCGKFAARLVESGTTRLILGHLSQENNTPQLAESTVVKYLGGFVRNSDYILTVAPVETRGEFIAF